MQLKSIVMSAKVLSRHGLTRREWLALSQAAAYSVCFAHSAAATKHGVGAWATRISTVVRLSVVVQRRALSFGTHMMHGYTDTYTHGYILRYS